MMRCIEFMKNDIARATMRAGSFKISRAADGDRWRNIPK